MPNNAPSQSVPAVRIAALIVALALLGACASLNYNRVQSLSSLSAAELWVAPDGDLGTAADVEAREGVPGAVSKYREDMNRRPGGESLYADFVPFVQRAGTFSETITTSSRVEAGAVRIVTSEGSCPVGLRDYVEKDSSPGVMGISHLLPRYRLRAGDCSEASVSLRAQWVGITVGDDRLVFDLEADPAEELAFRTIPGQDPRPMGNLGMGWLGLRMGALYDAEKGFVGTSAVLGGELVYAEGDQQIVLEEFRRPLDDEGTLSMLADQAFQFAIDNVAFPPVEVFSVTEPSVSSSTVSGSAKMACPFASEETAPAILDRFTGLAPCKDGDKKLACHPGCDLKFESVRFLDAKTKHSVTKHRDNTFTVAWSLATGSGSEWAENRGGWSGYEQIDTSYRSGSTLEFVLQTKSGKTRSTSKQRGKERRASKQHAKARKASRQRGKARSSSEQPGKTRSELEPSGPAGGEGRLFTGDQGSTEVSYPFGWTSDKHPRLVWLAAHRLIAATLPGVGKTAYDNLEAHMDGAAAWERMRDNTADRVAFLDGWYCNKNSKRAAAAAPAADQEGLTPAGDLPFVRDRTICRGVSGHDAWTKGKFVARTKKLTAAYEAKERRRKAKDEACIRGCMNVPVQCDGVNQFVCNTRYGGHCSMSDPLCRCCHPAKNDCKQGGISRAGYNMAKPSCRL